MDVDVDELIKHRGAVVKLVDAAVSLYAMDVLKEALSVMEPCNFTEGDPDAALGISMWHHQMHMNILPRLYDAAVTGQSFYGKALKNAQIVSLDTFKSVKKADPIEPYLIMDFVEVCADELCQRVGGYGWPQTNDALQPLWLSVMHMIVDSMTIAHEKAVNPE